MGSSCDPGYAGALYRKIPAGPVAPEARAGMSADIRVAGRRRNGQWELMAWRNDVIIARASGSNFHDAFNHLLLHAGTFT